MNYIKFAQCFTPYPQLSDLMRIVLVILNYKMICRIWCQGGAVERRLWLVVGSWQNLQKAIGKPSILK